LRQIRKAWRFRWETKKRHDVAPDPAQQAPCAHPVAMVAAGGMMALTSRQ